MSQRAIVTNACRIIGDSLKIGMDVNHVIATPADPMKIPAMSSPANADADRMLAGELAINRNRVIIPARWIFSFTKESCLGRPM